MPSPEKWWPLNSDPLKRNQMRDKPQEQSDGPFPPNWFLMVTDCAWHLVCAALTTLTIECQRQRKHGSELHTNKTPPHHLRNFEQTIVQLRCHGIPILFGTSCRLPDNTIGISSWLNLPSIDVEIIKPPNVQIEPMQQPQIVCSARIIRALPESYVRTLPSQQIAELERAQRVPSKQREWALGGHKLLSLRLGHLEPTA